MPAYTRNIIIIQNTRCDAVEGTFLFDFFILLIIYLFLMICIFFISIRRYTRLDDGHIKIQILLVAVSMLIELFHSIKLGFSYRGMKGGSPECRNIEFRIKLKKNFNQGMTASTNKWSTIPNYSYPQLHSSQHTYTWNWIPWTRRIMYLQ